MAVTPEITTNPFIELGFRPALLWIKNTSSSSTDWVVIDSERQIFNQSNMTKLYINSTNTESTIGVNSQMNLDFLSNGFKLRDSNNKVNASNDVLFTVLGQKHHQLTCLVGVPMPANINN